MLPAHTIATSPTKTSPTSRFGFGGSASKDSKRLRSAQSTRVPPSSQATNSLHMRSKSVPNESARNRNHHGTHSHPRDTQHHGHHHPHPHSNRRGQGDVTSSHKSAGKSGFSFSSTLQSISRSLTTMCTRTKQANPRQRRDDAKDLYRHL